MKDLKIHVILFQEEDWWVAQCLEHDIAVQARTRTDLLYELERVLVGHFAVGLGTGRQPFENLPEAPRRYWRMYEAAQPVEAEVESFRQGAFQILPDVELRAA